ncbi:unnamed protein product [Symbiodinium natans]|uniref:PROP1-like PPR domain-containing protein n=1 Tax=Symbiodinium natans TaxID=878477 RepID=A0A812KSE7_9DINO|nr:unnamed protein product [Symbiodinium natans]
MMHKVVADINTLIGACARSVAMQRAVDIVAAMQEDGVRPTLVTYNNLLHVYDRMSMPSRALNVFQDMQDTLVEPDVISFTSLVHTLGKSTQVDRAHRVLSTMQARHVEPNVFTFSALIAAYEKLGDAKVACEVLARMTKDALEPDVVCFNAAVRACARRGRVEDAFDIVHNMRGRVVEPSIVTYNALFSAYEAGGSIAEALQTFAAIRQQMICPNVITYSTLINACEKMSSVDEALTLFSSFRAHGLEPNLVIYTAAVRAHEKNRQPTKALMCFEDMCRRSIQPDIVLCNALMSACSKHMKWRGAFQLYCDMSQTMCPDRFTFNALISMCSRMAKMTWALSLLQEMIGARITPDTTTYDALCTACGQISHHMRVVQLVAETGVNGLRHLLPLKMGGVQNRWLMGGRHEWDGPNVRDEIRATGKAVEVHLWSFMLAVIHALVFWFKTHAINSYHSSSERWAAMISHMRSCFFVLPLMIDAAWGETNQAPARLCAEGGDAKPTRSILLFQLAAAPLRSKNITARTQATQDAHGVEHKELLAAEHTERRVSSKEALVQEFSARLATALGVTDIISLCVLALVFLLALYFVWGGTVNKLEENPYGELKNTGMRASREAKDKFNQWQARQEQGSPVGAYSPSQASSEAFPTSPADGSRRQHMSCC